MPVERPLNGCNTSQRNCLIEKSGNPRIRGKYHRGRRWVRSQCHTVCGVVFIGELPRVDAPRVGSLSATRCVAVSSFLGLPSLAKPSGPGSDSAIAVNHGGHLLWKKYSALFDVLGNDGYAACLQLTFHQRSLLDVISGREFHLIGIAPFILVSVVVGQQLRQLTLKFHGSNRIAVLP